MDGKLGRGKINKETEILKNIKRKQKPVDQIKKKKTVKSTDKTPD